MFLRLSLPLILAAFFLSCSWTYPIDEDDLTIAQISKRITRAKQNLSWLEKKITVASGILEMYDIDLFRHQREWPETFTCQRSETGQTHVTGTFVKRSKQIGKKDAGEELKIYVDPDVSQISSRVPLLAGLDVANYPVSQRQSQMEHPQAKHRDFKPLAPLYRRRDEIPNQPNNELSQIYIPPPKTDLTPELLNESLTIQPQNTATIGSVIPDFANGHISYHVQLDGLMSSTLILNASTSLPCDTIGSQPGPNLAVLPRSVKNGTAVVLVLDCLIIAVNMYNPQIITYWVQKDDGSIFSVAGDNKVHHLDKIDTSSSVALSIRTAYDKSAKRDDPEQEVIIEADIPVSRSQIFPTDCNSDCPTNDMYMLPSNTDICGCMFNGNSSRLAARSISAPDSHTAVMTSEACRGMSCLTNDGKSAIFNPFSRTCWCRDSPYIDVNPSGLTDISPVLPLIRS